VDGARRRVFRILLVEMPVPGKYAAAQRGPLLVALALEVTQGRELVVRAQAGRCRAAGQRTAAGWWAC